MCLFITAVLPRNARSPALEALVSRHRLSFVPREDPYVHAQLRPSEQYVHGTLGGCDCGSPLFFAARERPKNALEREIRKLKKKGWGEAKISRWMASTTTRPHQPGEWHERCWTVGQWADFLDDVLALPQVPSVGILGHWYSGGAHENEFQIVGRVRHTVDDLRSGRLGILVRDVIHDFGLPAPTARP